MNPTCAGVTADGLKADAAPTMRTLDLLQLPLTGSALIEASAGTGKTYTIAALYLRAVLGHGGQAPLLPPQVLVVTFTEAATGELTERIRQRLTGAARYFRDPSLGADPVLQQLAASFEPAQWPRCAQQLELAAQWMDDAAISTIHGWCNRMLSEHAFDSGSRFEDALSTDQSGLLQEVAEDYWRSFVYALEATALLRWQRSFRQPAMLLASLHGIWREQPRSVEFTPAQLIDAELTQRRQLLADLKAPWPAWVPELAQLFAQARQDKRLNGSKIRADYVEKWLSAIAAWATDPLQEKLELGAGSTRLTPEGIADACKGEPLLHPAFAAMAALQQALATLPDCTQDLRQHALAWCQQRFADSQRKLGCFGFDDMLDRLHQALASERGPVLAERIRQQFPLALIDEFQDTDPVQYGIFGQIYQLADNRADCGLLLIGDPKQAIYAFRGADIYTYLQAKQQTAPRHYSLDTNYRSSQAMVDTVNLLFLQAEQRQTGHGAFLFRQQANLVCFEAVKAKGRPEQLQRCGQAMPALELVVLDEGDKPISKAGYFAKMAQHCAGHIAQLLQEGSHGETGFVLPNAQLQPLQPQDIAVLVNNQQEATLIRQALVKLGVRSVYLSDRGSVFDTEIAADLLLWLEACADPHHELKVRSALSSQSLGWDYAQLARLQQDEWFFEFWLTEFEQYGRLWQQQGVLPLVRHLLVRFELVQRLAGLPDGERQLTDLLHLAELLQQASRTLEGEQALLRYFTEQLSGAAALDADMLKLRLESDEALVRVVTIHKSKGLEYPLVFLPFIAAAKPLDPAVLPYRYHDANQQLQLCYQTDEQIFAKADFERLGEDLRKLYVALTRSKHYCYLGVAALKDSSAISYLLTEQGRFEPGAMMLQLNALQHAALQQSLWQAPVAELRFTPVVASNALGDYQQMPKRQRHRWWAASYSALTEGAGQASVGAVSAQATALIADDAELVATDSKDSELYLELQQEQKQTVLPMLLPTPSKLAVSQLYLRGAAAGTLLHDCLQWAADQGFAAVLAQPEAWRAYLMSQCQQLSWLWSVTTSAGKVWQRRLLITDAEQEQTFDTAEAAVEPIWRWMLSLLTAPWSDAQPALSLAALTDYRAELEFWFAASAVPTLQLDALLQQWLWPQQARPALQPRLVHGMLKGFIDLTFAANGRYHVADYKSNYLEDAVYGRAQLVEIMLAKRYDLQAALYALALHRLLQSRIANYQIEQHLGQAYYWFVRGAQPERPALAMPEHRQEGQGEHCQGMLVVDVPAPLVLALDQLFRGASVAIQREDFA
jgi:exodeoxyribonuclease V beta subunit